MNSLLFSLLLVATPLQDAAGERPLTTNDIDSLIGLNQPTPESAAFYIELSQHPDPHTRSLAYAALSFFPFENSENVLRSALDRESDQAIRSQILQSLSLISDSPGDPQKWSELNDKIRSIFSTNPQELLNNWETLTPSTQAELIRALPLELFSLPGFASLLLDSSPPSWVSTALLKASRTSPDQISLSPEQVLRTFSQALEQPSASWTAASEAALWLIEQDQSQTFRTILLDTLKHPQPGMLDSVAAGLASKILPSSLVDETLDILGSKPDLPSTFFLLESISGSLSPEQALRLGSYLDLWKDSPTAVIATYQTLANGPMPDALFTDHIFPHLEPPASFDSSTLPSLLDLLIAARYPELTPEALNEIIAAHYPDEATNIPQRVLAGKAIYYGTVRMEDAAEELIDLLSTTNPDYHESRTAAAWALSQLPPSDSAVRALRQRVFEQSVRYEGERDYDFPMVRANALFTLLLYASQDPELARSLRSRINRLINPSSPAHDFFLLPILAEFFPTLYNEDAPEFNTPPYHRDFFISPSRF